MFKSLHSDSALFAMRWKQKAEWKSQALACSSSFSLLTAVKAASSPDKTLLNSRRHSSSTSRNLQALAGALAAPGFHLGTGFLAPLSSPSMPWYCHSVRYAAAPAHGPATHCMLQRLWVNHELGGTCNSSIWRLAAANAPGSPGAFGRKDSTTSHFVAQASTELHETWGLDSKDPQLGCLAGVCQRLRNPTSRKHATLETRGTPMP